MSGQLQDELDEPPSNPPEAIENFLETDLTENYAEELAEVLKLLGELSLIEAGDGLATVVPSYQNESDVPVQELGEAAEPHTALVHVEGEGLQAIEQSD